MPPPQEIAALSVRREELQRRADAVERQRSELAGHIAALKQVWLASISYHGSYISVCVARVAYRAIVAAAANRTCSKGAGGGGCAPPVAVLWWQEIQRGLLAFCGKVLAAYWATMWGGGVP